MDELVSESLAILHERHAATGPAATTEMMM